MAINDAMHLDHIEEASIRECLRDLGKSIGLETLRALAAELHRVDAAVDNKSAEEFLYRRSLDGKQRPIVLNAAMSILQEHSQKALDLYENGHTKHYMQEILHRHKSGASRVHRSNVPGRKGAGAIAGNHLDVVVRQWLRPAVSGKEAFAGGIYQIFRRFKPFMDTIKTAPSAYDWNDPTNHAIICELIFLEPENMECVSVTSEFGVYRGSLTLTHDHILYGLMSQDLHGGERVNFHKIALKVEIADLAIYPGLLLKEGDTTKLPITAECLFVRIPDSHEGLYKAMLRLYETNADISAPDKLIFSRYTTDAPPAAYYDPANPGPKWNRVKFVRQFPELEEFVKRPTEGPSLLREPSRAMSLGSILRFLTSREFPIFQWPE